MSTRIHRCVSLDTYFTPRVADAKVALNWLQLSVAAYKIEAATPITE
jgi:hypothetical protein